MMPDYTLWGILGAAAALAALWVLRVLDAGLNTDIFINITKKLVRDKNVSRALKLCTAAGNVPLSTAIRATLLASASREEETNRPATYRGSRPVSMDAVRERIRARYDEVFTRTVTPINKTFYPALLSPLLFVGLSYLAYTQTPQNLIIICIAGVGLLFWLYVAWAHNKIVSSRNAGFDALWPSFEAVYHDRNSINLDDKPAYPWKDPSAHANVKSTQITFEILEAGKPLRTVALDQPIIKIGNLATSHIQISGEGVARMHAVIEIGDGKATIIDLGAERQTKVNLEPVRKQELANGDVIGIGDVELVVRLGAPGESHS